MRVFQLICATNYQSTSSLSSVMQTADSGAKTEFCMFEIITINY